MAIEFEQNGREFWGSVLEMLLATGYNEDDVAKMSNPDVWNKVILPLIAQAGQQDLIRQMWFADTDSDSLDWNGYDGFMTNFVTAVAAGSVSHTKMSTAGDSHVTSIDLTQTVSDTITVVIDALSWSTTAANAAATATAFIAAHAADILSRTGIVATDDTAKILLTADTAGVHVTTASFSGASTVAYTSVTAGTAATLATDEVDGVMDTMLATIPNAMLALNPVFRTSRKVFRNLFSTWKALGTETANMIRFKGIATPHYEGIPIIVHPEWDTYAPITGLGSAGQIVLTPQKNLLFATDGTSDSEMIESWYNQEEQMRRYRVQYKAQTAFLHSDLLSLAGFTTL